MVGFPSIVGKGEYPRRSRDDSDETEKDRLQESINKWLSPPDPSTNHDIACATYHKDTALLPTWFFRGGGSIFQRWKGTASLLWIHGKRAPCLTFPRHHLIPYCTCSWIWKECPLVRLSFYYSFKVTYHVCQFQNH